MEELAFRYHWEGWGITVSIAFLPAEALAKAGITVIIFSEKEAKR